MLKKIVSMFVLGAAVSAAALAALPPGTPSPDLSGYASNHVFFIMLENRSDQEAMSYMPYLSALAQRNGIGAQMYSPSHGSWLAYGEVTAGIAPKGGTALNGVCNGYGCKSPINVPNLVRQFAKDGKSWKGYFQGIPSIGWMGDTSGNYARKHNPFPFFTDVKNNVTEQRKMVQDWQLANDLNTGDVANYSFIVPDLNHDGHNGNTQTALSNADNYLAGLLPPLLNSSYFQPGGDGVLIVTFDESDLSGDNQCGTNPETNKCGGHIFLGIIGPNVKASFQSGSHHTQRDVLRATCDLLMLTGCPGDGAQSAGMPEFFTSQLVSFSFGASPATLTVAQGASGNYTATATSIGGFAGNVAESIAGLPPGATATFTPNPIVVPRNGSGTSVIRISTTSATPAGTDPLTITGTSGNVTVNTSVSLVVTTNGGGGTLSVTPANLSFGNGYLGSNSSYPVSVRNTGTTPVTINGVSATANFGATTTCTTLSPGAGCSVVVTFSPTIVGNLAGTLTITDTATNSPQLVALSGQGNSSLYVYPTSLNFGAVNVGTVSASKIITVGNERHVATPFQGIKVSGDYARSGGTCPSGPSTLAARTSCTVLIKFTPIAVGSRPGSVALSDNAPDSPLIVTLSGTGQ